jgi:hypothetical protein
MCVTECLCEFVNVLMRLCLCYLRVCVLVKYLCTQECMYLCVYICILMFVWKRVFMYYADVCLCLGVCVCLECAFVCAYCVSVFVRMCLWACVYVYLFMCLCEYVYFLWLRVYNPYVCLWMYACVCLCAKEDYGSIVKEFRVHKITFVSCGPANACLLARTLSSEY